MNVRNFIGTSSALLLAWLGASYLREVPVECYPTQTPEITPSVTQLNSAEDQLLVKNGSEEAKVR